jgi:hypothetical protein
MDETFIMEMKERKKKGFKKPIIRQLEAIQF